LISLGGVIGKLTREQVLIMTILELIFYSINENLSLLMGVADIGGSTVIHLFGATFGVILAWYLREKK
jgi:ammonium transporter Rh